MYFEQDVSEDPPYPSDQGWFSLYEKTWLSSQDLNFDNSNQYSVMFEVFPIAKGFAMDLEPTFDGTAKTKFEFDWFITNTFSPWIKANAVQVEKHKWNRVSLPIHHSGNVI